jgi:DNA topoisomerase-1
MPKKPIIITNTFTLVIVESPAKCKKIEEYLGPGYKCIASYGHLRELNSLQNIDFKNFYNPTYTVSEQSIKKKQIQLIKKEIACAYEVILACDADREGESICFHLCELFGLSLTKTKRIIFHEISPSAINYAIQHPGIINMNLVKAQQARQILDLLVGFKITPILWKYINKHSDHSLSAGRCQTPALKIINDNQEEYNDTKQEKIHQIIGYFTNINLPFRLNKDFSIEDQVTDFLYESSLYKNYYYSCSKPEKIYKTPPEPFITSTLQQKASNDFHYSPKDTMKIAQQLYENGFITYMRTDNKKYSKDFINAAKIFIQKEWSENYIHPNLDEHFSLSSNQINEKKDEEAPHEAIRPIHIYLKELPDNITDTKQRKLYKLIWINTVQSCMADAAYYFILAKIQAYNQLSFTYKSSKLDFPGWKILSKEKEEENNEYSYLLSIKEQIVLPYKKIISNVSFKNTKLHYTEARLVQILEEKGIGRPSTFSSIVDKIQERGYVKKENIVGKTILCKEYELIKEEIFELETKKEFGNEKNKLVIQPLGIIVIEFLNKYFHSLFDYDFTKNMEEQLDEVANGNINWYEICKECDEKVEEKIFCLNDAKETKMEIKLDEHHFYIIGKYGPTIKCLDPTDSKKISFKSVKKDLDLDLLREGKYSLEEVIQEKEKEKKESEKNENILGQFKNQLLQIKKGKFGLYLLIGDDKTRNLKEFGNRPLESIRYEEVIQLLEEEGESDIIREISDNIKIRKSKNKSDYIFFKTNKMKKPHFFSLNSFSQDYQTCDLDILKEWIKEKHGIY